MNINKNLFFVFIFFIIIFIINFFSCKKIEENFDNLSTIIDTNKDSITTIQKKLNAIDSDTSDILKNSNNLLFKSKSDLKNYKELSKKYNQYVKDKKEIDYDINKLEIFKLLKSIDQKELLKVMDLVRTNMTDSQKQILDQYVNVSISGAQINDSMSNKNIFYEKIILKKKI